MLSYPNGLTMSAKTEVVKANGLQVSNKGQHFRNRKSYEKLTDKTKANYGNMLNLLVFSINVLLSFNPAVFCCTFHLFSIERRLNRSPGTDLKKTPPFKLCWSRVILIAHFVIAFFIHERISSYSLSQTDI